MGCGKSSVGRRIALMTGHRFVDTDELIVQREGRSITDIFASDGEGTFRAIEQAVIEDLIGVAGIVLATGGGAVLQEVNRAALHKIGVFVWLHADPDVLFERASRSNRRPLLQTENPRATFDALLASRIPIYETAADFQVDSTGLSHDETAKRIVDGVARFHAFAKPAH